MLNIVVLLLCFPKIDMNVHLPMPDESCPLFRIADDIDFNAIIAVPPGLYVEFHCNSDSDVQKLNFDLFQVLCSICLNLSIRNGLQCTFVSVKQIIFTSFDLSV